MNRFAGLRIAHVTGPNILGGVAICVLPLCKRLAELGAEVTMQINDPRAGRLFDGAGVKAERVGGLVRPIRPAQDLAGIVRLARWMRARRFDVVHTHTSKGGFMGRLAARLAGVPLILHTAHGLPFHEFSHPAKVKVYSALKRLAALCCDKIISVSREHGDWIVLLRIAPREKVVVIRNGVQIGPPPDEAARHAARALLGLDDSVPLLLCAGRVVRQKNHADALRAMISLSARFPGARLLIAGDGPLRPQLELLAQRLGVRDSVSFLGFRSDVPSLLAAADVVPMPSLWEGMPLALLEAMAACRPCVANAIMGIREVVRHGETGILVPPKQPEALAAGIAAVLQEPDRAEVMARNARRQVEAEFSVERFLREHEALYAELLGSKIGLMAVSRSARAARASRP
jgi:glycosyltransferase involved in cell wall biosynthesis